MDFTVWISQQCTFRCEKIYILKLQEEKQIMMYTGASIRLTANFISETMEARRQWDNIQSVKRE